MPRLSQVAIMPGTFSHDELPVVVETARTTPLKSTTISLSSSSPPPPPLPVLLLLVGDGGRRVGRASISKPVSCAL
jgi:hypothetical protein